MWWIFKEVTRLTLSLNLEKMLLKCSVALLNSLPLVHKIFTVAFTVDFSQSNSGAIMQ